MSRADLIEIIYQYKRKNDELTEENLDLSKKLSDRIIRLENSGSIAEAAMTLNGIFDAAQQAADDYLDSLKAANKSIEDRTVEILTDAKIKAEEVRAASERYYSEMKRRADAEYAEKIARAEEECEEMKRLLVRAAADGKRGSEESE